MSLRGRLAKIAFDFLRTFRWLIGLFLQISFGLFKEAQVEFKLCLEQFVSAPSIVRRRCAGAPQLNPSAPLD